MFYLLKTICLSDILWRRSDRQLTDVFLPFYSFEAIDMADSDS